MAKVTNESLACAIPLIAPLIVIPFGPITGFLLKVPARFLLPTNQVEGAWKAAYLGHGTPWSHQSLMFVYF